MITSKFVSCEINYDIKILMDLTVSFLLVIFGHAMCDRNLCEASLRLCVQDNNYLHNFELRGLLF